MTQRKKRQQYEDKFKAKVALEAFRGNRTISELSSHYKVQPTQITQWRKKLLEESAQIFSRKQDPEIKELKQKEEKLYQRIGEQTIEIDFLKKNCEKLNLL